MKKLALACILFASLAACGPGPVQTSKPNDTDTTVSNGDGAATVSEVTLKDGTKCAVLIGYYKGAISCNWQK